MIRPKQFESSVNGIYVKGYAKNTNPDYKHIKGELIAVDSSGAYILKYSKGRVFYYNRENIKDMDLILSSAIDHVDKSLQGLNILNSLFPLSHGAFMLITYPINFITMNGIASSKYKIKYGDGISWHQLPKYARFPQGLPENIHIDDLRRTPY